MVKSTFEFARGKRKHHLRETMRSIMIISFFLGSLCSISLGWGEDIQSIQADFVQNIISEEGIPARYEGKIIGKAPSKVKWTYKTPLNKTIYMSDKEVIIYEPLLAQVSHSYLKSESDFISVIRSAKEQKDGTYHAKVDGVTYIIHLDDAKKPKLIEFTDSTGTKTALNLRNVKLNVKLSDKEFEFTIPQDVDVVELR